MKTTERTLKERWTAALLATVGTCYSPEVSASVIAHYDDLHSIGGWELEEMLDDLLSKVNDRN